MTIKRQFTLLIILIIAIPIICSIFLIVEKYRNSPSRYLIQGFKDSDTVEAIQSDYDDGLKIIQAIPPEIKSCLIDITTTKIIFNTIPELNNVNSMDSLWETLTNYSVEYFYQFTSPKTKKASILITRIPRHKPKATTAEKIIGTLLLLFIIGIVICIFSIFFISRTIFNSIIVIKDKTKQLANGNLDEIIISKDGTHQQNEIISILESLEKMRQSLSEVEKRKTNFIMGISHDLRTPVAIIKGYTEAITDGIIASHEDLEEAILLIGSKTNQLEYMINDLIDFTKLNNLELRAQLNIGSISDTISFFAKEAKLAANVFNRNIITNINLQNNYKIPFNKQLILRAFENLFSNAIRYTKDGDTIQINAYTDNEYILFEICDNGVGISKESLPHIFDLFYKKSSPGVVKSMGIGLSVVKNVLDTHGWDIEVQSEKNKGTCFRIKIPTNNIK